MYQRGRPRDKRKSFRKDRSAPGSRWIMTSDNDNERMDDAMLVEEDRQQQQQQQQQQQKKASPVDAPSTKLSCREDTSEKALTKALTSNIGNSIGTSIANLIVELSKHGYRKQLDKAPEYFSARDKKKKSGGSCVSKLNEWFAQLKNAHTDIANYLVKMCKLSNETSEREDEGEVMTIAEMYTRDIRNVIRIVLLKEKLFNNSRDRTIISRGLVKFDSIVDASSSLKSLDRSEVLYAAIASEGKDDATDALIQLNKFKELVTTVLCPRVTQMLLKNLNLGAVNAVYAFSEIVKYVEEFNTVNGKLPGLEFRNLLTDINIKILESDITLDRERPKEENRQLSAAATTVAANKKKTNEAAKRNLIRALRTISESKPLSDGMPLRQDTASDVLYMPNSAELVNVPLPPVDLLIVTNYVNSLLSLEKMAVFTPGTFKSTCMMINQCLSPSHWTMATGGEKEKEGGNTVEALARKIAKKGVAGATETSNNIKRKKKERDEFESSEDEEESEDEVSGNNNGSSESGSDSERPSCRSKRKKIKKNINPNFLTDNSIILNSIRQFINKKQYKNIVDYVNETASDSNASENTKNYIISALTDALVNTLEERDTLKHSIQHQRSVLPMTETSKLADKVLSVRQDIVDVASNKALSLTFMLSDVDRMAIYRHESVLFNYRLIPSNSKNGANDLIHSFFNQSSVEEMETEDNAFCPVVLPKLNDFAVAVTAQAAMLIQTFTRATSAGEIEDKIKNLRSLRIPGGVPDPSRDNNISEFMDRCSSLTSKPRELLKSKLVAVVAMQPSSASLLYPSSSSNNSKNDEDAFTRTIIRWHGLINRIESLEEVTTLRNNVASASSDESLAKLLFPPSRGREEEREGNNNTIDSLTIVVDALFALVDATSRLVLDDERKVVLILDDSFLDRVVDYLYRTYNASASAVYRDAAKASSNYYYGGVGEEKRKNEVGGGDCPSIFARRVATATSEEFLKKTSIKISSSNQAGEDPSKKTAESGLVKEVSDRASDIVKSQIANVVITTVIINAAKKLQYMDERRLEMLSANNENIPVGLLNAVNYTCNVHDREARKGLIKSVNRLSVYIGLSAARDMLRLSNGYFFSVLRESGVTTSGRGEGDALKERKFAGGMHGRRGDGGIESSPSWRYTALKSTLDGRTSNKVRKTGKEREHSERANVIELLREMI